MDFSKLNSTVVEEMEALNNLLRLLEEQHEMLVKNDVVLLYEIAEKIKLCNKDVAEKEVQRRNFLKGAAMKEAVQISGNGELDLNYRSIKKLLKEIEVQKNCNETLIKMGLGFSTRMLAILNPDTANKTYNSYGRIKR
jgi:flagellar biosynthesis/type III secretory pathway chaperone